MKLNRRILEKVKNMETTAVFKGISVSGDIKGSHNLYLNGEFEGTLELTALLFIGKTGRFKGEAKAESVIIEGEVEGKVIADEKVELMDGGKYKGEIIAPSVSISNDAFFDGNVKMVQEGIETPVPVYTRKSKSDEDDSLKLMKQS